MRNYLLRCFSFASLLGKIKECGRSTLGGQRPMKSPSSVCPSVSLSVSVLPSLSFLKIGSLVFSDIVHDDSWPWYLVTDEVWFISFPWNRIQWQFHVEVKPTKKNSEAQIWAKEAKIGPRTKFFRHFLKFSSLIFFEIAYGDHLQQCITSSRGKTHEKKFFGPNLGQTD